MLLSLFFWLARKVLQVVVRSSLVMLLGKMVREREQQEHHCQAGGIAQVTKRFASASGQAGVSGCVSALHAPFLGLPSWCTV